MVGHILEQLSVNLAQVALCIVFACCGIVHAAQKLCSGARWWLKSMVYKVRL